jgi:hypothetical protein
MTTLSLECSKKIYDLIGEYETEQTYSEREEPDCLCGNHDDPGYILIPKPNFAELIRLIPKIGKKKGWKEPYFRAYLMTDKYMETLSEREGMQKVEEYFLRHLT